MRVIYLCNRYRAICLDVKIPVFWVGMRIHDDNEAFGSSTIEMVPVKSTVNKKAVSLLANLPGHVIHGIPVVFDTCRIFRVDVEGDS
jgi:hypothetical protein